MKQKVKSGSGISIRLYCGAVRLGRRHRGGGRPGADGTEERRAHAASLAVIFPISVLSAALYGFGGFVPLKETLWRAAARLWAA